MTSHTITPPTILISLHPPALFSPHSLIHCPESNTNRWGYEMSQRGFNPTEFWTPERIAIMKQMDARGCSSEVIAAAVGAPRVLVVDRELNKYGDRELRPNPHPLRLPVQASVIAERDMRSQLAAEREARAVERGDVTAIFFGDPLPGRSALDQRQSQP